MSDTISAANHRVAAGKQSEGLADTRLLHRQNWELEFPYPARALRTSLIGLAAGMLAGAVVVCAAGASDEEFVVVPPVWQYASNAASLRGATLCHALQANMASAAQWGDAGVKQVYETNLACKSLAARDTDANGRAYLLAHLDQAEAVTNAVVVVRTYCETNNRADAGMEPNAKEQFCAALASINGPPRSALRMSPPVRDEQVESFSSAMPVTQQAGGGAKFTGSPEQQFIEGLTNFVLDRAKLEAILHFEERFRDKLCVPSPDTGAHVGYFHAVCNVLGNANEAGFSVAAASRELRASARADLQELPDNVLHQKYIESGDYVWEMSRVWFALARALRDGRLTAEQIPQQLANIDAAGLCQRGAAWPAATLAQIANDSLRDKSQSTNRRYADTCLEALRALSAVGTLLATADKFSADDFDPLTVIDALALLAPGEPANKIDATMLTAFLDRIAALTPRTGDLHAKSSDAKDNIENWRNATVEMRREKRRATAQRLLDTADEILDLADAIAAAYSACDKLSCGFDGNAAHHHLARSVATVRKYDNIIVSIMENDWADVASRFSELFLHENRHTQAKENIGHFAPVVSEIAGAQSAVEVQSILNNAAAPVASYREKFQGRTRSITAFAGVSVGRERNDGNHNWGDTRGLFLPVGLHITWPCERSCYGIGKGARGAFFSLIDLGPYVDYRDSGAGVERDTTLGLRQLFAPGAYLTWNISTGREHGSIWDDLFYRSPFVFGIGVARTAALIDSVTGQRVEATRVQAFFAIDVTIFPF